MPWLIQVMQQRAGQVLLLSLGSYTSTPTSPGKVQGLHSQVLQTLGDMASSFTLMIKGPGLPPAAAGKGQGDWLLHLSLPDLPS